MSRRDNLVTSVEDLRVNGAVNNKLALTTKSKAVDRRAFCVIVRGEQNEETEMKILKSKAWDRLERSLDDMKITDAALTGMCKFTDTSTARKLALLRETVTKTQKVM